MQNQKNRSLKSDFILPFQLEKAAIRGRLVRLKDSIKDILDRHKYPTLINRLTEELIALAVSLANLFKYEGVFTLQISGTGPVRLMVVDVTHQGEIRACARFDEEAVLKLPITTSPIHPIFGTGYLAFTITQDIADDRYQGIVELEGASLSECLHHFFRQSDQLETGIIVFARSDTSNPKDYLAASMMIQRIPPSSGLSFDELEAENDAWLRCLSILGTTTSTELLSSELSAQDILFRLFWEDGIRIFESRTIIPKCSCSRERVETMLQTFSKNDIQDMIENDVITVTCEFCNQTYTYDPQSLTTG